MKVTLTQCTTESDSSHFDVDCSIKTSLRTLPPPAKKKKKIHATTQMSLRGDKSPLHEPSYYDRDSYAIVKEYNTKH